MQKSSWFFRFAGWFLRNGFGLAILVGAGWLTYHLLFDFDFSVDLEIVEWVVRGAVAALTLWLAFPAWRLLHLALPAAPRPWRLAWAGTLRLFSWWVPAVAAAVLLPLVLFQTLEGVPDLPQFAPGEVIRTLLPLFAACQAAFLYAPADEPPAEILAAVPRPLRWLVWERWLLLVLPYAVLALVANLGLAVRLEDLETHQWAAWIPPFLFFTGAAFLVTASSRQPALGMAFIIVLWAGMVFMTGPVVARWPFLWPIQVYIPLNGAYANLAWAWFTLGSLAILNHSAHLVEAEKE